MSDDLSLDDARDPMKEVTAAVEMFREADRQVKHHKIKHHRVDNQGVLYTVPELPVEKYDALIYMEKRERFSTWSFYLGLFMTVFTAGMVVWWGGDNWLRWMATTLLPAAVAFFSFVEQQTSKTRINDYIKGTVRERDAEIARRAQDRTSAYPDEYGKMPQATLRPTKVVKQRRSMFDVPSDEYTAEWKDSY